MHNHSRHHHHDSTRNLRTAFFLNLGFTIAEIIGGLLTNSLAILSDAVHDLGDSLALGLAWFMDQYAQREKDSLFSYGYQRFSLLGAMINILILVFGSIVIFSRAIPRLLNPEPTHAPGMIIMAVGGILVNGAAVLRLRGGKSINTQVVAWHLLEDVLGWVAVLLVSITLIFTEWYILDPLLSILITCYILFNVLKKGRKTLAVFLQSVPEGIRLEEIEDVIQAVPDVDSIHHTHIWSLDGEHHVLTTHVVLCDPAPRERIMQVKDTIKNALLDYDLSHITIEIEYGEDDCTMKG
jgi:cobalt-zinc-cadmium efflux system protein